MSKTRFQLTDDITSVSFGLVSMTVYPPSPSAVNTNITAGQQALARARNRILKPGVTISAQPGVPLFSADPKQPEFLIRRLDGKIQRGKFTDGKFQVAKSTGKTKVAKAA